MEDSDKTVDPEGVTGDEPAGAPQQPQAVISTVSLDLGKRFGQLIGRYKVVRVLGEGGMGTVFLAEQDKPTRLVALKVIRLPESNPLHNDSRDRCERVRSPRCYRLAGLARVTAATR